MSDEERKGQIFTQQNRQVSVTAIEDTALAVAPRTHTSGRVGVRVNKEADKTGQQTSGQANKQKGRKAEKRTDKEGKRKNRQAEKPGRAHTGSSLICDSR